MPWDNWDNLRSAPGTFFAILSTSPCITINYSPEYEKEGWAGKPRKSSVSFHSIFFSRFWKAFCILENCRDIFLYLSHCRSHQRVHLPCLGWKNTPLDQLEGKGCLCSFLPLSSSHSFLEWTKAHVHERGKVKLMRQQRVPFSQEELKRVKLTMWRELLSPEQSENPLSFSESLGRKENLSLLHRI